MRVFLGGTCAGWRWRDELQPLLECDYYNPIVKKWSEEDRLREVHERETCDFVLYGITNAIKGVYSIAEVVDDANKRPEKTLFLNLYSGTRGPNAKQMAHSIEAVENLLKANGVKCFHSIHEVAQFLNERNILFSSNTGAADTTHGQWKPHKPDKRGYAPGFTCSCCARTVYMDYFQTECEYDFCPHCGVKMDGGNE